MTSTHLPLRSGGSGSEADEGGKKAPEIGIHLTAWAKDCEYKPANQRFHYLLNATVAEAVTYVIEALDRDPSEIWLKSQDFDTVVYSTQTRGRAPTKDEPAVPMAIVFKGAPFSDIKRTLFALKPNTEAAA